MNSHIKINIKQIAKVLSLALLCISLNNCSDLLDAANPNNLLEEDLEDSRAYPPMVNGSEATVTRALAGIYASYATATDELTWIGSRDAWNQLDLGNTGNPNNEFVDQHFFFVAEARWWADDVIRRGEGFQAEGTLANAGDLTRAYIYGAIIYISIADMFDDFVIGSNKLEPAPPVGPANMGSLYDVAIGYLNKANSLTPNDFRVLGLLARAHQSKGIWAKVNPVASDPLVSSAEAASFAEQALSAGGADEKYILGITANTTAGYPEYLAGQVNSRLEMRISDEYVISDGKRVSNISDGDPTTSISLLDPIDNVADPALYAIVDDFVAQAEFADLTAVSAREMHLIMAENSLANGDTDGFTTHINNLRTIDKLTAYSGQVDAVELLEHARRTNLFLQGRRLADHYRFGSPSVYWINVSDAVANPGVFFPITISEIQANPNLN